ncbi:SCO2523 family variant P-loop protein [Nocardia neocaledoniensis]|uniref:SCO2523 family variant P-loop protein n=1 Tax=Nocardia neocaledoniensis TaxID=236511 RepID=UPI002456D751|nr:SCO2523 family variant P-loop protein [Nocardia neocaledoniensis]
MIVFATSDKGGTGRSVTSCNLAYRLGLRGISTAYLDFDFGSPTAGALFEISAVERGTQAGSGLHSYLRGHNTLPQRIDVRANTNRDALRSQRSRGGKLVLLPGDEGGGEAMSANDQHVVRRCRELLLDLDSTYKVVIVDLSAGRSVAMQIALEATRPQDMPDKEVCWLVYHRWTRQHLMAAQGLVHGPKGLLKTGVELGYAPDDLLARIRFVRTAVPRVTDEHAASGGPQAAWLLKQNDALRSLAAEYRLGAGALLGETPVEPVLQWREQIVLDADVNAGIANRATVEAFEELARRLWDRATWVRV